MTDNDPDIGEKLAKLKAEREQQEQFLRTHVLIYVYIKMGSESIGMNMYVHASKVTDQTHIKNRVLQLLSWVGPNTNMKVTFTKTETMEV